MRARIWSGRRRMEAVERQYAAPTPEATVERSSAE